MKTIGLSQEAYDELVTVRALLKHPLLSKEAKAPGFSEVIQALCQFYLEKRKQA